VFPKGTIEPTKSALGALCPNADLRSNPLGVASIGHQPYRSALSALALMPTELA